MEYNQIIQGDCIKVMRGFPNNSIDTIITDPPYGLKFMGKKWDYDVPSIEIWQECLRVLKPGGTALIFAGSRTQHRMAVNVEDAGWIIKDCIMWLYGSGFPKSLNIGKAIDKLQGSKREVIGKKIDISSGKNMSYKQAKAGSGKNINEGWDRPWRKDDEHCKDMTLLTKGNSDFEGYGTALKPAYEPIIFAIKKPEGTYANNALKWGVAGLNIDGGRIEGKWGGSPNRINSPESKQVYGEYNKIKTQEHSQGRFPANIILDEEAGEMLDEQSGTLNTSYRPNSRRGKIKSEIYMNGLIRDGYPTAIGINDTGGASRFFYCAKASKAERNRGCEGLEEKLKPSGGHGNQENDSLSKKLGSQRIMKNNHPTVKPLALMKYLCTITKTPKGGIVLDPFCGSGTTLMACKELKRNYIGIEKDEEYCEIARNRIKEVQPNLF